MEQLYVRFYPKGEAMTDRVNTRVGSQTPPITSELSQR